MTLSVVSTSAVDGVFQFADVAGQSCAISALIAAGDRVREDRPFSQRVFLDEVFGQGRDVLSSVAAGWAGGPPRHSTGSTSPRGRSGAPTSCCRSRLLVAMIRTFQPDWARGRRRGRFRVPATRAAAWPAAAGPFRRFRRAGWCRSCAASSLPIRWPSAPENAPRSWPKTRTSSSCSGIAAQFTATNGPLARCGVAMDVARDHLLSGAGFAAR